MRRKQNGSAIITLSLLLVLPSVVSGLTMTIPLLIGILGNHPPQWQFVPAHCPLETAAIDTGTPLKIMNWNIQFLAGRYYPFWQGNFDQPALTEAEMDANLERIAALIRKEQPDILNLQEVHLSSPVTLGWDQLEKLHAKLKDILPCFSYGSYWKARFIPKKHMTGNIDVALVTMSRYRISEAHLDLLPSTRKARALVPFYPRHSLLHTHLPLKDGRSLTVMNTHMDAPTLGRGPMDGQSGHVLRRLKHYDQHRQMWLLSGDFNLTPPGFHPFLPKNQQSNYSEESLLAPFYRDYLAVPSQDDFSGDSRQRWMTAYDINQESRDLIIDYLFAPPAMTLLDKAVIDIPLDLSDHAPIVSTVKLPDADINASWSTNIQ